MLLVAAFAALLVAGLAGGATSIRTYKLSAVLTVGQERPKPPDIFRGARGTFTGTLVGQRLTFKLTYHGLSGRPKAAHIHLGAPDTIGPVLFGPLCVPRCPPDIDVVGKLTRTASVSVSTAKAIRAGRTYVEIHTAKNPRGEIRGQIKARSFDAGN